MTAPLLNSCLDDTVALLARLVVHRSTHGDPSIRDCLADLEEELAVFEPRIEWHEFDGVPNLLVNLNPDLREPRLLYAGHVDVVEAQGRWHSDPWSLDERNERFFGRGTADMKGGIAAFVGALHLLAKTKGLQGLPLTLVLTGDEETGSAHGMVRLLGEGLIETESALALCGEPTGLDVFLGNRGLVWIAVRLRGRGGHAGLSHQLASPIPWAAKLALALEGMELAMTDPRFDPPSPTLNVTRIDAGGSLSAPNVIPDDALIVVDRRLLPGEEPETVVSDVKAVIEDILPPSIGLEMEVLRTWPPYITPDDSPLVALARNAVRQVGRSGALGTDPASDDSSWLGQAGITTILLGPGEPEQAHASDESVSKRDLRDAIESYAIVLEQLQGGNVR